MLKKLWISGSEPRRILEVGYVPPIVIMGLVREAIPRNSKLSITGNRPKQSKLYEVTDVTGISVLHVHPRDNHMPFHFDCHADVQKVPPIQTQMSD